MRSIRRRRRFGSVRPSSACDISLKTGEKLEVFSFRVAGFLVVPLSDD